MRTSLVWTMTLSVALATGACRKPDDTTDDTDTDSDVVINPDTETDTVPDTDDTEIVDTEDTEVDTEDTEVDTEDTEVDTEDTEVDTEDTEVDTLVIDTDETGLDTLVIDTDETGVDTLVIDTDETGFDTDDTFATADTGLVIDTDETDDTLVVDTDTDTDTDTDPPDTFVDTFFLFPTADTYDTDDPIATADTFWDDDSGVPGNLAFRGTVRDFDAGFAPIDAATVALRVSQAPLQISQTDVSGRFLFRPPVASQGELTVLQTGYFSASYFPRFRTADVDLGLYLFTNAQVSALATAAGVTPSGSLGHAVLIGVDANGALLSGVNFNVVQPSGQTPVFFDTSMAVTAPGGTSADGAAIVFNQPSGTFTARATHPSLSCASLVAWPGSVAREGIVRIYPSQISVAVYQCQ